ncbi:MAG: phosphatidylglycerol lysyltransferase domain-containing protein [Cytophagales bacterium]|nr:phosphatidylglycerol lysyltransferase domain-containing protein [Cytophagales bacterium]
MKKSIQFISTNYKLILQITLALFFAAMGVFFMIHEQAEVGHVKDAIISARPMWLIIGIGLVLFYVLVMAWMYQYSFKAISKEISLSTAIILFLKRNFISVFLPAGVLTNMAFFNNEVEKKEGVGKTEIYFASSIYTFCSILSTVILGIPVLMWLLVKNMATGQHILGLVLTVSLIGLLFYAYKNFQAQGRIYLLINKFFPSIISQLSDFGKLSYQKKDILKVLALSVLIEIIGIVHLYIAMVSLNVPASWEVAIMGYSIILLILMSSPFLRGIGAIEVTLVFLLTKYDISEADAISITFLFRFFEFWSLLVLGIFAFVLRKNNLLFRILPAIMLFFLGVVNILSVLSPAMHERLDKLHNFLPLDAIDASNYLVLFSGFFMFIVAAYLIKGLKLAWIAATILCITSFIGHILKGIDYEEATIALITFSALIYERKQYYFRSDRKHIGKIWFPATVAAISIVFFGTVAFFFLDIKHFGVDFSFAQSFKASVQAFFLFNYHLKPITAFGGRFLFSINALGLISMIYLVYAILKPLLIKSNENDEEEVKMAMEHIQKYGNSNLDYFKTYFDKKFWISENHNAVVSFKNTKNYAIVLENPVVNDQESLQSAVIGFEDYCKNLGLRTAYYRVRESDTMFYENLGKRVLPIGEEAFINLAEFSTDGRKMKAFRNAVSKVTNLNLKFFVNEGPHKGDFLQKLRAVSDSWLVDMERKEIGFSQGIFIESELKNQTILSVEDEEGKIIAFINLIPSTIPSVANFDLIRKTADAPGGTVDFLYVKMLEYFKLKGYERCTLGMVHFSGIQEPNTFQERIIKLAYEKIARFSSYRNLRFYKEKFEPVWEMQYLVYDTPLDLFFIPSALEKVIKI